MHRIHLFPWLGVIAAAGILMFCCAPAQAGPRAEGELGELVFEERLAVTSGGLLSVDVPDADIELLGGATDQIEIMGYLRASNMKRAQKRFARMELTAEATRSGVEVFAEGERGWQWSLHGIGNFAVTLRIRLPEEYNLDIRSADGDIYGEHLKGDLVLATSDGDIELEDASGELDLHTSDGDIALEKIDGVLLAETSDGDLRIRASQGSRIIVRTSDGDIRLSDLQGLRLRARTSDGDIEGMRLTCGVIELHTGDGEIELEEISGALDAATSDGDIAAEFERAEQVDLQTDGGNIWISVPGDHAAEVDLEGEGVRIRGGGFDGRLGDEHARGELNGGGSLLAAVSKDGDVTLEVR